MTGYGLTGPMTARGTVFDAKAESTATTFRMSRYRYRYAIRSLLFWMGA